MYYTSLPALCNITYYTYLYNKGVSMDKIAEKLATASPHLRPLKGWSFKVYALPRK